MIQDAQGQATIIDDDPAPSLRINDQTVTEGAAGATGSSVFTVSLSSASGKSVTVALATANQTATGGGGGAAGVDYGSTAGSLTFASGQTTQTLSSPICGDGIREGNEKFSVGLSGATNATIQDATGVATIIDDEPLPALSIAAGVQTAEPGFSGQFVSAAFTVKLGDPPTTQNVSVNFATAPGTASAGTRQPEVPRGRGHSGRRLPHPDRHGVVRPGRGHQANPGADLLGRRERPQRDLHRHVVQSGQRDDRQCRGHGDDPMTEDRASTTKSGADPRARRAVENGTSKEHPMRHRRFTLISLALSAAGVPAIAPAQPPTSLTLNPPSITGGTQTPVGTVTLSGPAAWVAASFGS